MIWNNGPNEHLENTSSNTKECTFFSAPNGTFSKIDNVLGHKVSLNSLKKTDLTPCGPSRIKTGYKQ